jgi:hypothetical protein
VYVCPRCFAGSVEILAAVSAMSLAAIGEPAVRVEWHGVATGAD